MTERDVILEKTNNIQNCLKRISETIQGDLKRLETLDAQDIVILNLQRAVQAAIDIGAHVVKARRLGLPKTIKDNFVILEKNALIESSLAEKMCKMVGFRNIAVHDYGAINRVILQSIVEHHLSDLEEFYSTILKNTRSS
jgi:uncharacterized protein YutE (UPF0331/DUF86 family)